MAKSKKAKQVTLPTQSAKSSLVVTSRQILNGWTSAINVAKLWAITPIQMISKFEKDDEWKKWNLDWFERIAYHDLSKEWKGISKDYDMAEGILTPEDYGCESEEYGDYVKDIIDESENTQLPIMFFPLIPPFVNLLVGEYLKRDMRMIVRGVDEFTVNKKSGFRKDKLMSILSQKAQADIQAKFGNPTPENQEQIKQASDYAQQVIDNELKFKTYETLAEQWANRMIEWDDMRFSMKELQTLSFRDVIVSDRTYIHVRTLEDDIYPEVWNPKYVFRHIAPDQRWASESNYIGRQIYMPLSDIIKNYSHMMDEADFQLLQTSHNVNSITDQHHLVNAVAGSHIGDKSNWTDFSKPYPENITDVTYENALLNEKLKSTLSIYEKSLKKNTYQNDLDSMLKSNLFRVTETYWRSYVKQGTLTKKGLDGIPVVEIVDEDYIITEKPVYDLSIHTKKSKDNLISGEHIDWYWKPQIRFGAKISRRLLGAGNYPGASAVNGDAIYISGDPIDLQIGQIPIEGYIHSDRNTKPVSLVRKLSPAQICFNIVNNQNLDMLGNNLANGKVIMIDQNYIPKKSFDGTWGKNSMNKWLEVIRNTNVALMDGSPGNNPQGSGFSHFQVLDFSNTPDILRNIQLGEYYKNMAFSLLGITPQRTGATLASESATGVQASMENSYAQTEYLFEKHLHQFMPRVRQLMLSSEQYLASTKPSVRVSYTNTDGENILFEIEGKELLLPDLKLFCQSSAATKALVEKMQNMAMQINTVGAEMSDYMKIFNTQSPSKIIEQLEKAENKRREEAQNKQDHDMQMMQEQQKLVAQERQKELDHEDYWNERELQTKVLVAEIQELGGIQTDADANKQLDSLENLKEFNKQQNFDKTLNAKMAMDQHKMGMDKKNQLLQEKTLATRNAIEEKKVQVARINKNRFDKK